MDVSVVKSHIKSKKILPFYIFTGPEWAVQSVYIKQICTVLSAKYVRVDSITDVYRSLKNTSFLTQTTCYIARDDKEFINSESLQNQVDAGLLGKNVFILLLSSVDKRTKFYKKYEKVIVDFEPLTPTVLDKYIQKQINLTAENRARLAEICENDYGRILLEIDKIKCVGPSTFAEVGNPDNYDANAVFKMLLADGTIYIPPKDAVFDLVDAILDRRKTVFKLFNECRLVGEATLVILSVLYTNAKAVLQVQSCESTDIAKSTGLSGWEITNAKKHMNRFRNSELVSMLKLIQRLESGIKKGEIAEDVAVNYLLVNVL